MNKERSEQILNAGIRAVQDRLCYNPKRTEYPRDYLTLYNWLEDKIFNLYESIMLKKTRHIFEAAGEVIFTVSEIAELSQTEMQLEQYGEFIKVEKR